MGNKRKQAGLPAFYHAGVSSLTRGDVLLSPKARGIYGYNLTGQVLRCSRDRELHRADLVFVATTRLGTAAYQSAGRLREAIILFERSLAKHGDCLLALRNTRRLLVQLVRDQP